MSKKLVFKLNKNGVRELMRSPAMTNVCRDYAAKPWSVWEMVMKQIHM